jgi:D-beta-D-heptose 7-phosphate kinase/D-beta-D-heptose 1-phosphate adenosyltransferase
VASSRDNILDWAGAVEWRRRFRGRLVFTNGIFELLHPGHVDYLEAARALGDGLVVGINSDLSAAGISKGPGRPFTSASDRARIVAGLAAVDLVVPFDEPTPLELIRALEPDVLVKGGDYRRETIVGAELVESRGGTVAVIPLTPHYSTTELLERIRASS